MPCLPISKRIRREAARERSTRDRVFFVESFQSAGAMIPGAACWVELQHRVAVVVFGFGVRLRLDLPFPVAA